MKRMAVVMAAITLVAWYLPIPEVLAEGGGSQPHDAGGGVVRVSGYKFEDLSGEGIWDSGEPGLSGWTIYAHTGPANNNVVLASAVTDADGYYELQFENWDLADQFFIAEDLQPDWKQTLPGAYSDFQYPVGPNQGDEFINVNFGNKKIPDEVRQFTGYKFDDLNGNRIWDQAELGIAGWAVYAVDPIGSFQVPAAGPAIESPVFEAGVQYIIRARGTVEAGENISADAQYSVIAPSTDWSDTVETYASEGSALLNLHIDGLSPYWGEYNDYHAYFTPIIGTGTTRVFEINDVLPSDNSGDLFISIYEVLDMTVTDISGHYSLAASDWVGDDQVIIMESVWLPGWRQTFPGGDHDFMHYISWEEAWTYDWAYNFGNQQLVIDANEQIPTGAGPASELDQSSSPTTITTSDESSGGGSGGGGGGSGLLSRDNAVELPPIVLGDTDDNRDEAIDDDAAVGGGEVVPPSSVLSETEELPRTGLPPLSIMWLGSIWLVLVTRRES